MKRTMVFYKQEVNLLPFLRHRPRIAFFMGDMHERMQSLRLFECNIVNMLFVPYPLISGWRSYLTPEQCEVEFAGEDWDVNEMVQGQARLTVRPLLDGQT